MLVCVISKVLCSLASDCDPERGSSEVISVRAQKIDCEFCLKRAKSEGMQIFVVVANILTNP